MKKLEIIIRHSKFSAVKEGLTAKGLQGMSISDIKGMGRQGGHKETYRGSEVIVDFVPKVKLEVVLDDSLVESVISIVRSIACTGEVGDGKIFVLPVEDVVRIRTGERGQIAL
ncbi:MAG: P-II family nitrogen regulator [Deltaproteobacteria bacterium]|jgi:nitrogen regulatory protein P-II 1|nr:P-II family nitrogen regulator [Deltaproteobacteria bacterium]